MGMMVRQAHPFWPKSVLFRHTTDYFLLIDEAQKRQLQTQTAQRIIFSSF